MYGRENRLKPQRSTETAILKLRRRGRECPTTWDGRARGYPLSPSRALPRPLSLSRFVLVLEHLDALCPADGGGNGSAASLEVRQLRHHFWTIFRAFLSSTHPTRAVGRVLLGAQAYLVLIGACNPMICPIWGFRFRWWRLFAAASTNWDCRPLVILGSSWRRAAGLTPSTLPSGMEPTSTPCTQPACGPGHASNLFPSLFFLLFFFFFSFFIFFPRTPFSPRDRHPSGHPATPTRPPALQAGTGGSG